jgi:hypothetical protein
VDEGIVDVRNQTAPGPSVTLRKDDSVRVYHGVPLVAAKVDKGNFLRRALYVAREAYVQVMVGRPAGGGGGPAPGAAGGAQGDKGKDGDSTKTGPGAPPSGPGTPPAGPGGK